MFSLLLSTSQTLASLLFPREEENEGEGEREKQERETKIVWRLWRIIELFFPFLEPLSGFVIVLVVVFVIVLVIVLEIRIVIFNVPILFTFFIH